MRNKIIIIALFAVFILGACVEAQPLAMPTYVFPTPSQLNTLTVSTFAPVPFNTPVPVSPAPSNTPSPTVTATSTLDYAALGLPSPTATPTFDYDGLASFYLTPFTPRPTPTGFVPQTPTANIPNMLSSVVIKKVTPQPPPIRKTKDNNGNYINFYQNEAEWVPVYIQTATDLMNYTDADQKLYLQFIESWMPTATKYSPDDWFLKRDFDNDGQVEWLVSIPVRFEDDGINRCGFEASHFGFCPRFFFIFEKIDNIYYPKFVFKPTDLLISESRVALIDDLNNDGIQEIIFRADPCGAAVCSTDLSIGRWNGQRWEWIGHIGNDHAEVTFADIDNNGTIEIRVAYTTYAASRYNSPYSGRKVVDVYGWKIDRYELVDQIYPPTDSVFEIIFDIAHALEYKNAELAFKRINPVMESLDQSCDRMRTYVGIQAMLAYAIQGDSNEMKSTLTKLEKYCDKPRNAYVPAAKILWLAYEKSHDPISACQAMERFLGSEYNRENGRWTETLFIDDRLVNRPSCPRE
jgi:hypothetical protein